MVAIAPFRALRFHGQDLQAVTSLPNDVIPPRMAEAYKQEAHNICHLILPGGDYEGAAARLAQWMEAEVLRRDDRPAFYTYEVARPGKAPMFGFFARLRLDPSYTDVRRHEKTLGGKKDDRLRLQIATSCNLEPIWLLYRDENAWVEEILGSNSLEKLGECIDEDGARHRLWRVDRPEAIDEVIAQFDDRGLVIADGHHRYQTAVEHYAQTGFETDGSMLVCLVRDQDPGIGVVATHRLIVERGLDAETILAQLPGTPLETPPEAWPDEFDDDHAVLVTAKMAWRVPLPVAADQSRLAGLAVSRLHEGLARLGIDAENAERHLRYTRDAREAVQAVADGEAEAAFLLPPEPVDAVLEVAQAGGVMPQKSTYFVPKLRSGLVLSPLDEPLPVRFVDRESDAGKADFRMPPLA